MGRPVIASASNDRIKRLRRLRRRRARDDERVFLVEGYREVRRAIDAGIEIAELYTSPALYLGEGEPLVADLAERAGARVFEVDADPFQRVTTRDRPDGLLAVAAMYDVSLDRQSLEDGALLLVTEGVERPGNLGTMLRAACGAGVTGVVVCDPTTDVFAPEVVRASTGALFQRPVSVASTADAIAWLRGAGVRIVTASPDGARDYWDEDLRGATAIVVGSEQHGVTEPWLADADAVVRIPMSGLVDSLNVAVAASVLLFDAIRQRGGGASGGAADGGCGHASAPGPDVPR